MKKILILAMLAGSFSAADAQKLDASKVPTVVKTAFGNQYPGVGATWEKEDANYEVNFKQNGNTMSVIIDPAGSIIETEMDIKTSELPAASIAYVKSHYKNKSITEAAKITRADGSISYEAEVGDIDVVFDSNGNFIKEIKKRKEEKGERD
jgi:hypothetical protein